MKSILETKMYLRSFLFTWTKTLAGGQSDSSTYLGCSEIRSVTYFLLKKKPYLSDYISESII